MALVASAAKSLTHKTCTTKITVAINAVAAVTVYYYSPTWIFPVLLILGGLVTLLTSRNETSSQEVEDIESLGLSRSLGAALIVTWLVVLAASVAAWQSTSYETHKELHWWESFYRIGSLIFGGGQVMPLYCCTDACVCWLTHVQQRAGDDNMLFCCTDVLACSYFKEDR